MRKGRSTSRSSATWRRTWRGRYRPNGLPGDYVFASVFILLIIVGILFFWTKEISLGDLPSTLESAGNVFRARILRQ